MHFAADGVLMCKYCGSTFAKYDLQVITIDLKTESLNQMLRGASRWARASAAKKAAMQRKATVDALNKWLTISESLRGESAGARDHILAGGTLVVKLTRHSAGRLDDDNLAGALKHVRDGVADWVGVDDGDQRYRWVYGQKRVKRGTHAVSIEFELGGDSEAY